METTTNPQTTNETDEEREERVWHETQAEEKRLREEAAAFEPNVGATVYQSRTDPLADRKPNGSLPWCSVALTITKRTAKTFTVEDGTRYKLATGRYQSNIRSDGTGKGYTFTARRIGRYGNDVTAKPLHATVYTKAELDAKLKERYEEREQAADKARREKLDELGVYALVREIIDKGAQLGTREAAVLLEAILTSKSP